jgi:signal transduction histidine kinase
MLLSMFHNYISVKIISLIVLLAIVVFAVLIAVNSYWQRVDTMDQIQNMGYRTTDLIELNIEEPMLLGDNQGTHEQFHRIDSLYDDLTVYLTDFRGNITYSTRADIIRENMNAVYLDQAVLGAMWNSLESITQKSALVHLDDGSFFMTVRSVPNEPECYHCHGRSQPILGSMLVMQNVDSALDLLHKHQLQNVLLSLGCLLLLIFTLVYFLKKTIINRITSLHEMEKEVTGGNLDAEFQDLGRDELGKLAQGFEKMVNNLKQKIREARDKSMIAEEQSREANLAIEELVDTQQKLIQSERFAAIGEAASHLSHEIKNPLMIMAGFAGQIRRSVQQNSPEEDKLNIIIQEAQRLEKMLYQVRDFTRPRKINKEPSQINQLISDTVKIFDNEFEASKIKCQLNLSNDLPLVNIDKDQIKQVLLNLIKNSLEAMPGGGALTIGSRIKNQTVLILVEDTGPGIPPDKTKKIFSPFFTTKDKGTGLGLAVSYRIIQDHGGDIFVDSKPCQGAKFMLHLPLAGGNDEQNREQPTRCRPVPPE